MDKMKNIMNPEKAYSYNGNASLITENEQNRIFEENRTKGFVFFDFMRGPEKNITFWEV